MTIDTHDTKEEAESVCSLLKKDGLGGERCHFPISTRVEPIAESVLAKLSVQDTITILIAQIIKANEAGKDLPASYVVDKLREISAGAKIPGKISPDCEITIKCSRFDKCTRGIRGLDFPAIKDKCFRL